MKDPRRTRPGTMPLLASAVVHAAAGLVVWATQLHTPTEIEFIAYEIELVSPPPVNEPVALPPPPQEELVVETPEPAPSPSEEDVPDPDEQDPETQPAPQRTTATAEETEENPDEVSAEEINVRMEG